MQTRQARADFASARLAALYPTTPIPLDHTNVFTLLVAVLLSAQCTDKRVNLTTPALFTLATHAAAMAQLSVAEIDHIVRPCGLAPRKAEAIRELSAILVREHGGEVPASWAALEALPGVGHKTASVVMAQGFGVPAFPVDTHIHRLAQRWRLTTGRNVVQTERDLKALFPPRRVERPPPAHHLLRPRILHRPLLRRHTVRTLRHLQLRPPPRRTGEKGVRAGSRRTKFLTVKKRKETGD